MYFDGFRIWPKKYRTKAMKYIIQPIEYMEYNHSHNNYMYKFERSTPYFYHPPTNEPEKVITHLTSNVETKASVDPESEDEPEPDAEPRPTRVLSDSPNIYYPSFIVDPLSLIVKLVIVGKKPSKTKISITNHSIIIHEPGFFQRIVRYYNNSTKQDLHYLQSPIEVACVQYIIGKKYAHHRDLILSLFKHAVVGLERLADTYKQDSMVVLCINHYINIIHNSISLNCMIANKDNMYHEKYYNDIFIQKMNQIWSPEKIDIVLRLAACSSTNIRSLETFIESVDADIYRMLKNDCSDNV